jgi:hypothetical protein
LFDFSGHAANSFRRPATVRVARGRGFIRRYIGLGRASHDQVERALVSAMAAGGGIPCLALEVLPDHSIGPPGVAPRLKIPVWPYGRSAPAVALLAHNGRGARHFVTPRSNRRRFSVTHSGCRALGVEVL